MTVPKPDKKTRAAMEDRMRWLKGWLKKRNYDIEDAAYFLFAFYNTARVVRDYEYAVMKLRNINNNMAEPLSEEQFSGLVDQAENREAPYHYQNETLICALGITAQEEAELEIGKNKKEAAQRKVRVTQKKIRNLQVKEQYQRGASAEAIAKEHNISVPTVKRILHPYITEQKAARNEKIRLLTELGFSPANIAISVGCDKRTVFSVQDKQKGSLLTISEREQDKNALPIFQSAGAEDLYHVYSVKIEHSILDEQSAALQKLLYLKQNIYLYGAAGTGKSTLIKRYLDKISPQERAATMIIAPTGKAADNLDGITVHTAFELDVGVLPIKNITSVPKRLFHVHTIIIDEISMLRIDTFDRIIRMVWYVQRKTKKRIRIIVVGDFGQLSPVAANEDKCKLKEYYPNAKGLYAFQSPQWEKLRFQKIMLCKTQRQDEPEFVAHLTEIKYGNLSAIEWFNKNTSSIPQFDGIYICPTNKLVDYYNQEAVKEFAPSQLVEFAAVTEETPIPTELPCPKILRLAVGMKIMTVCNESQYKNGSIGKIQAIYNNAIQAELENGNSVIIRKKTFHLPDGTSYTQLPVILAYALTVNKAQGCTFGKINIVPGFFAPGQLYTALSRCRTVKGIYIDGKLTPKDLIVDEAALQMTI